MAESRRFRVPMVARILVAMALGVGAGFALRPDQAKELEKIGTAVIDMVKALAAPLLFFAILDAFLRTEVRARSALRMVAISAVNATIAVVVGLTLSNVIRPGDRIAATIPPKPEELAKYQKYAGTGLGIVDTVLGHIPTNAFKPFVDNAVISIILLAVLAGAALRRAKEGQKLRGERDYEAVESVVVTAFRAVEVMLGWVIVLVPLAVFAAVATSVQKYGFRMFGPLAVYVGVATLGLAFQVFVVYQLWIVLVGRMPLRRFWAGAKDAIVYAMGAASSMATLPVTLRCLDRMKVSPQSARLAACVGTNLNNDGILLYEAMAALFVAQAAHIPLDLPQQLAIAAACVVAGIGISGVPDAGLISLTLVLGAVDLPLTLLPVLLTVDWLIGRMRAMTNVTSDLAMAVVLDRWEAPPDAAAGLDPT